MNSHTVAQATPRKRDPEQKRKFLLKSARSLFVDQGFEATTTKQIAEHAGVSEGILFHQFGSKVGLFTVLVEEFSNKGAAEFLSEEPHVIELEQMIRKVIAFGENDRPLFQVISKNEAILEASGVPTFRDIIVPAIETRLRKEIEMGSCHDGDSAVMAEIQFSIVEATYIGWLKSKNKRAKDAFIAEGVRCLEAVNSRE